MTGFAFEIDRLGGGFYGAAAYELLFEIVGRDLFRNCRFFDGDTNETLSGSARRYCIAIEADDSMVLELAKRSMLRATDARLCPSRDRVLDETALRREPLVYAARVDQAGRLDSETPWIMQAWIAKAEDPDRSARSSPEVASRDRTPPAPRARPARTAGPTPQTPHSASKGPKGQASAAKGFFDEVTGGMWIFVLALFMGWAIVLLNRHSNGVPWSGLSVLSGFEGGLVAGGVLLAIHVAGRLYRLVRRAPNPDEQNDSLADVALVLLGIVLVLHLIGVGFGEIGGASRKAEEQQNTSVSERGLKQQDTTVPEKSVEPRPTSSDHSYSSYMRKELYPARVRSFTLPGLGVVDASNPTSRMEWKIAFGDSLPHALYHERLGQTPELEIQDLVCTSAARGSMVCDVTIVDDGTPCMLFVGDDLADSFTFGCPSELTLVK